MDPVLVAEQKRATSYRAILYQIDFPGGSARFTDGGFVPFDSGDGQGLQIFWGQHPAYGSIEGVQGLTNGQGDNGAAPELMVHYRNETAKIALTSPTNQGSGVRIWTGRVDRETGFLIGAPKLEFSGLFDVAHSVTTDSAEYLSIACITEAALQKQENSDWALNHSFQTLIWPGEMGLSNVTGIVSATRTMEWRS
jgi:hypothetical protein